MFSRTHARCFYEANKSTIIQVLLNLIIYTLFVWTLAIFVSMLRTISLTVTVTSLFYGIKSPKLKHALRRLKSFGVECLQEFISHLHKNKTTKIKK